MSASATEGKSGGKRRRASSVASDGATAVSQDGASAEEFICPECGKSFARAQALGAHRNRTHGVAGTSRTSRTARGAKRRQVKPAPAASRRRSAAARRDGGSRANDGGQFDRDGLIAAVFPKGVPPKASVIAALSPWLDEGERLSRMS